uniref:Arrestin-like N-terminal domain-containing protein n=1 Tax=Phlebotomus papatasi TaxID=29031 RepID=A0A1B0GQB2_PHLPP
MRINVVLDSPEGMYFAGDKITGEVTVDIDRPETLKKITATLRGVAKIAFREGGAMPFLASSNLYHDQQTVISREMIVFANPNICPVMEKGTYSYSFNFLLPNSMVTSFNSSHGYVIYNLDIAVKKKFFTERIRKELKIYEFNEDTPQLSYRPLCFEKILLPRVSCFFPVFFSRKDARARCHIYIPRISFYCGETIQVNVLLMDYQVASKLNY